MSGLNVSLAACVLAHSQSRGTVRMLLYRLALLTDARVGYAYPSLDTLHRELNVSVRRLRRAIQEAVAAGELRYEEGRGEGHTSRYWVLCGRPELHGEKGTDPPRSEAAQKRADPPRSGTRRRGFIAPEKGAHRSREGGPSTPQAERAERAERSPMSDDQAAEYRAQLRDASLRPIARRAALRRLEVNRVATDEDRAHLRGLT